MLNHKSSATSIEEKMNHQITLCLEHNCDCQISYLQKHTRKHTLHIVTLDQFHLNLLLSV